MNTANENMSMTTIYTVQQLMLQSFIASGLVPDWRLEFANSIATQKTLSTKQAFWVDKIVQEILNTPAADLTPKHDFGKIFALFETARKHLKFPKIKLVSPFGQFQLSVASKTAKNPGSIALVTGRYGFIGSILLDGSLSFKRHITDGTKQEVTKYLIEFNKDPIKMSVDQGKLHSRCCFCYLPLKTQESLAVGYGDICAKHWGLPWGKKKITDPEILEFTPVANAALVL
jgi:hypothetical protein